MTPEFAVEIFRHTLLEVFWLALPVLAIGFVVGIAVSLLQVLTSIQTPASVRFPAWWHFSWAYCCCCPG